MNFTCRWARLIFVWACACPLAIAVAPDSALAQPSFTVSPSSITFPNLTVGLVSVDHEVTVTNTGTTGLTIDSYTVTPLGFLLFEGHAPVTLAPGQIIRFGFGFAPDAAQTYNGSFTLNVHGAAPVVVPLAGTGVSTGAAVTANPSTISFGSLAAGTTSPPQTVTVTNVGTSNMSFDGVTVNPPFQVTGLVAPKVLKPGASLTFQVSAFGTLPGVYASSAVLQYNVLRPSALNVSVTVTPATKLAVSSFPTLPSATVKSPYLANLDSAGGVPPYKWRLLPGSTLPPGLGLSSSGAITGNLDPTVTGGNYSFVAQVQDSAKPAKSATKQLILPVAALTGAACSNIVSNIPNTTNPLVPIDQLGTGRYQGSEGGLYPDGSNVRPPSHDAAGVSIAQAIQPLDGNGNPDPNGKYALMSVGSSAAFDTWLQFVLDAGADSSINTHLVFVSAAQPRAYSVNWADPNSGFWNATFENFLPQAGVTANQVVAVWFQNVDPVVHGTFPEDMAALHNEFEIIAQNLHTKFPNLKLMYFGSQIYGGYSHSQCPEPDPYETAFPVKWTIEDQINGLPSLNYDSNHGPVKAPWMSWASYIWTNGLMGRNDRLTWACVDSITDGCHPSKPIGREKVSNLMLNFFKTDATTTPWFLAH